VIDFVELRLANDLVGLANLAEWVERFGAEQQLSASVVNALNVVLDEAISNAINHGYDAGVRGEIAVRLRRAGSSVAARPEPAARRAPDRRPRGSPHQEPDGRGLLCAPGRAQYFENGQAFG
jgi:anti-sigma regulatory factor (Ser/Thr protein kinase)